MPPPRATGARLPRALGRARLRRSGRSARRWRGGGEQHEPPGTGPRLPTLMAGLSQRREKPVSTLRRVHFRLHCSRTKYQTSALYSVFRWLHRSRTFRSILGSTICGGTCSWEVPALWLWCKQVTCLPHCTNPSDSGSRRLVAVGCGTGLVCAWCHSPVPVVRKVRDFCGTVSQRACSHRINY